MAEERPRALAPNGIDAHITDVLKTTLSSLKKLIGWILFVSILAFHFEVQDPFRKVLAPICSVPGMARTSMCYVPKRADYARLSQLEGSTFGRLLDDAVGSTSLSFEIKKAEMAAEDLIVLVEHSDLKGRDTLAKHLWRFAEAAKTAGDGLVRLNARVDGAVDSTIAVNERTLRTIEAMAEGGKSSLSIFHPFASPRTPEEVATTMFGNAMSVLSRNMKRIILEAEVNMKHLDHLEEMLFTLHGIVTRETNMVVKERDELLARLYTHLGGNRRQLKSADLHLDLLRQIDKYRQRARGHVVVALNVLKEMSAGMEDLRERVATPELLGDRVPVEVHVKSIQAGMNRLVAQRASAELKKEKARRKLLSHSS